MKIIAHFFESVATFANRVAKNIGIFLRGMNITTPKTLNIRWAKATVTPTVLADCPLSALTVASEARIAVTVVPILAPKVNGYAWFKPTTPAATRGTIIDVVTELL